MKELSIKYNKSKIFIYIGLSIILLVFFVLVTLNYEYLAHRKPSSFGRYKLVGELFYERKFLLLGFSLLSNLLFLLMFVDLLLMLIRGKLELKKVNGIIYKNGKYFVEQKDINKIQLFDSNNNSSILIHLKSLNNVVQKRESHFDKLLVRGFLLINKNRIQLRLSFLDKSKDNYNKISEFLTQ